MLKSKKVITGFYQLVNECGNAEYDIINLDTLRKLTPEWKEVYQAAIDKYIDDEKGWVFVNTSSSYEEGDFSYEKTKAKCISEIEFIINE